ncbi:hypothetical protein BYT27DRAFT_7212161 [Phlegmacium glaucopus]|nr:hypothetical protein BYT27DRAFT_7212161 [Phlegmacium glaucopus]
MPKFGSKPTQEPRTERTKPIDFTIYEILLGAGLALDPTFSESEFECFHHLLMFATPPPLAMSTNTSDNNTNNTNNTRNNTNDGDDSPIGEFFLFTTTAATSHTTSP